MSIFEKSSSGCGMLKAINIHFCNTGVSGKFCAASECDVFQGKYF